MVLPREEHGPYHPSRPHCNQVVSAGRQVGLAAGKGDDPTAPDARDIGRLGDVHVLQCMQGAHPYMVEASKACVVLAS